MRNLVVLLAASAAALPLTGLAAAEVGITATGPVVELSVYESVEIAPDTATIGAGVTTEAPTAIAAMRQNAAEMQKVIARIKALGVAEKDIQTTGISLNARYDYDQPTQRPVFRGYIASNRVSVILRSIDDIGKVLDALVEAGANDLSGPSFSASDDTAARDAARTRAVERARAQAAAYGRMLGYADARVLTISETMPGPEAMPMMGKAVALDAMTAGAPPVQPGMVQAGVNVTISFELVGNPAAPAK